MRRLLAAALLLALAGCSSPSTPSATQPPSTTTTSPATGDTRSPATGGTSLPRPAHVLVVVFENKEGSSVVGSADAPYLTSLARQGTYFSDAHGVTHPSEPDYLALFSGSTQGVSSDACPLTFSGPNLAGELMAAGHTFTGFSEDLPKAGFPGCSAGGYARKHNPWVDFPALPTEVNQPYSALPSDLSTLPTVAFVIPNLCHDMHDCDVATGDAWARAHLGGYVHWAHDHDGLLIVTFDENDGSAGNRFATFVVGPMVRAGTSDQRIDHYSVLRTLEDMYGLARIGKSADAAPITGVWTGS